MDYYIDLQNGSASADGSTPQNARSTYDDLALRPGDRVLFRRGTFVRERLKLTAGTPEAPICYGAYGTGKNPVFCGSENVADPTLWEEIRPNIWLCHADLSEVCNFILDDGEKPAILRWEESLLTRQGDWFDSRFGTTEQQVQNPPAARVLMYSNGNPAAVYETIECAVAGERNLAWQTDDTVLEDLCFFGSGVHGLSGCADRVTVRRCQFRFIGGAVWHKERRIRFGNAIEFWEHGEGITVENCSFDEIYDSCITVQGTEDCLPATDLTVRGNLFLRYGMAAYEGRDKMLIRSVFEQNICLFAGGGFSALGDTVPRNSEIYPEPMGHHLFLWRMTGPVENGGFTVRKNLFGVATGAAIYARIDDRAMAQVSLAENHYAPSDSVPLVRLASQNFTNASYRVNNTENAVFEPLESERLIDQWFSDNGFGE